MEVNEAPYQRHGRIGAISLSSPPVNALGQRLRAAIGHRLAEASDDPEAQAVVIIGAGRMFSAGADISEFGRGGAAIGLGSLIERVEASSKLVVAAIHGQALGSTGRRLGAGSNWRWAATTASPRPRRGSDCRRSSSASCPGPAGRSGCRAASPLLQDWYVKRPKYRKRNIAIHGYIDGVINLVERAILASRN